MIGTKPNTTQNLDEAILNWLNNSGNKKIPVVSVNRNKASTFEEFISDKILISNSINGGVPLSLFELIVDYSPFSENDWAEFLSISTKTLQRYRASSNYIFKPIYSEKIFEIAEVTLVGLDVFGSAEKLNLWLLTPNYALGSKKPFQLIKDSYGKNLVISELIRISHGILV